MADTSIHPTGIRGSNKGKDGPICAPRNPNKKGILAKASAELDRRRRDYNMTINARGIQATAFRQPGSMKT